MQTSGIVTAINKLKVGKTVGTDNISAEIIRHVNHLSTPYLLMPLITSLPQERTQRFGHLLHIYTKEEAHC